MNSRTAISAKNEIFDISVCGLTIAVATCDAVTIKCRQSTDIAHHCCWFDCRFLGGNEISCVEGLSCLNKLQELFIENQRLPVGDHLEFEPESLNAIAVSCY